MSYKREIFFLGIGGISMSSLARYYHAQGVSVFGYDKTPSPLTSALQDEGIVVYFEDDASIIGADTNGLEVIYTPAVPTTSKLFQACVKAGVPMKKRAEAIGDIVATRRLGPTLAVAGTHGKTTTSTLLAHLFEQAGRAPLAFLGGLSTNYQTNLLLGDSNRDDSPAIVEADEFDRSFLQLSPEGAIITSADPDHLDIYGDAETFAKGFQAFASQVYDTLIIRKGLEGTLFPVDQPPAEATRANIYTYGYSEESADITIDRIWVENGLQHFALTTPWATIDDLPLGLPGRHNAENAAAAASLALAYGLSAEEVVRGVASYQGVHRRFDVRIRTENLVYIDDYAHHPTEINALYTAVRELYPEHNLIAIFQPHLYSRTQDFKDEFVKALARFDMITLMPIYAAREQPIKWVSSESLQSGLGWKRKQVAVLDHEEVLDFVKMTLRFMIDDDAKPIVLLTIGAGDIDRLVAPIEEQIKRHLKVASLFLQPNSESDETDE